MKVYLKLEVPILDFHVSHKFARLSKQNFKRKSFVKLVENETSLRQNDDSGKVD